MAITILKDSNNANLNSGIVSIHAALVPTASGAAIVYFGTDDQAWMFDVDDLTKAPVQLATKPGGWAFCSAHAFLSDGRWVIAGGVVTQDITHHDHGAHDSGERRCEISGEAARDREFSSSKCRCFTSLSYSTQRASSFLCCAGSTRGSPLQIRSA